MANQRFIVTAINGCYTFETCLLSLCMPILSETELESIHYTRLLLYFPFVTNPMFTPFKKMKPTTCIVLVLLALCLACAVVNGKSYQSRRERVLGKLANLLIQELSDAIEAPTATADCPPAVTKTDAEIDAFLAKLNSLKCLDEKLVEFDSLIGSSATPFTMSQASKIIAVFSKFSFVKKHIVGTLLSRLAELKGQEVVTLLKSLTDSTYERMNILDTIKSNIVDLQTSKQTIISGLFDALTKQKVTDMLNNVKPHDCVFGAINGDNILFTIDVSPSMINRIAKDSKITRLDFVNEHFATSVKQLTPQQNFEVMVFCDGTLSLFKKFVPATPENVNKAIEFARTVKTCGSTNLDRAIRESFGKYPESQQTANVVYLLSDGIPTSGETNTAKLIANTKSLAERYSNVKINTISFALGNNYDGSYLESENDKKNAALILSKVAEVSGGVFKLIKN